MRLIADADLDRLQGVLGAIRQLGLQDPMNTTLTLIGAEESLLQVLTNIEELSKERPYQVPQIAATPVPPFTPCFQPKETAHA